MIKSTKTGSAYDANSLSNRMRNLLSETAIATVNNSDGVWNASFLSLLEKIAPSTASGTKQSLSHLGRAEEMSHIPIIGVCGLMNSGKSSVTGFHLSADGRQRINIGDTSEAGTHRFVLWAPKRWEEDQGPICAMLKDVFDCEPEKLSQIPAEAMAQYNAREARAEQFSVPLIAFDEALDAHSIALLDCPDIQRAQVVSRREETSNIRREALARAGKLCSAFFVVSSIEQQESADLDVVMKVVGEALVEIPVYYILTKTPEDSTPYVNEAENRLAEMGVRSKVRAVFISPRIYHRTQTGLPEGLRYFDVRDPRRSLLDVAAELDKSNLQLAYEKTRAKEILQQFDLGVGFVRDHFRRNEEKASRAREDLLAFLRREFLDEDKNVRLPLSGGLMGHIRDSFDRTRPWYFSFFGLVGRIGGLFGGSEKKDTPAHKAHEELHSTKARDFAAFLEGKRWLPTDVSDRQLEEFWIAVNNRAKTGLSSPTYTQREMEELDKITEDIWESVPKHKKAVALAATPIVLISGLITVMMAPIDFGGSAIFYSATVGELLVVAGLAGLTNALSAVEMQNYLAQRYGVPYVSQIFAYLQDMFGIQRASTEDLEQYKNNRDLGLVKSQAPPIASRLPVLESPYGTFDESIVRKIQEGLKQAATNYF